MKRLAQQDAASLVFRDNVGSHSRECTAAAGGPCPCPMPPVSMQTRMRAQGRPFLRLLQRCSTRAAATLWAAAAARAAGHGPRQGPARPPWSAAGPPRSAPPCAGLAGTGNASTLRSALCAPASPAQGAQQTPVDLSQRASPLPPAASKGT